VPEATAPAPGLVVAASGPRFWVRLGEADVLCSLRGRLKRDRQQATSLVVVGDRVTVAVQPDGTGVIQEVAPRRTALERPGFRERTRLAAANLDLLVIVQATRLPAFNRHLVERFQAIADRGGMSALIVVNKIDLEDPALVESWLAPLRALELPIVLTCAKDGRGIEELREALVGRLAAMVGPSGVGKSRLVNALDPGFQARVGEISRVHEKGKHTTTASRLYPLEGGGYLADTPGIRELALFEGDPESLAIVFPEIVEAASGCKFRGCSHSHEPACAVKAAVEAGMIDRDRYQHYLRLAAGG
jgi:ribosome biogenesis GTPase